MPCTRWRHPLLTGVKHPCTNANTSKCTLEGVKLQSGPLRTALVAVGVAAAARVLAWLTPGPTALLATLRHPQEVAVGAGVDTVALAAASAACWLALLWLAFALTASAVAALPGRCGQLAERVAAVTVPAAARRLLAVTLGLTVATVSAGAPAMAGVLPQQRPAASSVDLDWPVASERAAATPTQATRKPSATADVNDGPSQPGAVIVLRGDSLWTIAAGHLPPGATDARIAIDWPRWYTANRSVIGADPNLLLPGQRLVPPANPSGGQP